MARTKAVVVDAEIVGDDEVLNTDFMGNLYGERDALDEHLSEAEVDAVMASATDQDIDFLFGDGNDDLVIDSIFDETDEAIDSLFGGDEDDTFLDDIFAV